MSVDIEYNSTGTLNFGSHSVAQVFEVGCGDQRTDPSHLQFTSPTSTKGRAENAPSSTFWLTQSVLCCSSQSRV